MSQHDEHAGELASTSGFPHPPFERPDRHNPGISRGHLRGTSLHTVGGQGRQVWGGKVGLGGGGQFDAWQQLKQPPGWSYQNSAVLEHEAFCGPAVHMYPSHSTCRHSSGVQRRSHDMHSLTSQHLGHSPECDGQKSETLVQPDLQAPSMHMYGLFVKHRVHEWQTSMGHDVLHCIARAAQHIAATVTHHRAFMLRWFFLLSTRTNTKDQNTICASQDPQQCSQQKKISCLNDKRQEKNLRRRFK